MLIKQWADTQAARHILDNEDEDQQAPLIPQIELSRDSSISPSVSRVFVVPSSISVVVQSLPKTTAGTINVRYTQLDSPPVEEEFDEDEQLYAAASAEASKRKYPDTDIPIYKLEGGQNSTVPTLAIVVPHFTNPIAEKAVATYLVSLAREAKEWIVLAPCQLNNGLTISRLDLAAALFPAVPLLRPPHFITGIGAAVISDLAKNSKLSGAGALVLNSEGHPGFEKVDADAVMDAATQVYGQIFGAAGEQADALKKLSSVVRKLNSSNTSGMYL